MKVTLPKEEFAKLDSGEIHSDKGLRRDNGTLSSIPDISPVSDDDRDRSGATDVSHDGAGVAIGLLIGVAITVITILSDEDNRKKIKAWFGKTKQSIKDFFQKKTNDKHVHSF